jgi:hypothetical protein
MKCILLLFPSVICVGSLTVVCRHYFWSTRMSLEIIPVSFQPSVLHVRPKSTHRMLLSIRQCGAISATPNFHTFYNSSLVEGETPLVRSDSFTSISHYRYESGQRLGHGLHQPVFETRQGQEISILQNTSDRLWGQLLFNRHGFLSGEQKNRGVKLTTHLHLVPSLRMSGAITFFSLYIFVAWRGTELPFFKCISPCKCWASP